LKEGVVFCTYATLISASASKTKTRLQQLVNWCGGSTFDGCLIFDECHKAKNYVPGQESKSTKTGNSVVALQRVMPMARVVYCSATGMTNSTSFVVWCGVVWCGVVWCGVVWCVVVCSLQADASSGISDIANAGFFERLGRFCSFVR
jgi:hypothetical protein